MINYPGSLDTIDTLFGNLTDVATTTLNNSINSGDLVITVSDPTKFPLSRQIILIENELILFTNRTGNVFNVEQRGAYGTTPASHPSGARFRLVYSSAHHNTVVQSIMAQQSESQYYRSPVESDIVSNPNFLSPSEGQQWIVGPSAVGAWATKEGYIARWADSGWIFTAPLDGMTVYVRSREGGMTWKNSEWITQQTTEQRYNTIHGMRTGLISGGELTIAVDPSKFNLEAGSGYFIDTYTNPAIPTYKYIEWPQLLDQPVPGMAGNLWTFISIDNTGTLVQSNVPPTTEDLRNKIFLGVLYHRDHIQITDISNTPSLGVYDYIEQDYIDIERIYNKSGNIYAPISGLTIQKAAGITFGPSINYTTNRQDPNTTQDPQLNTVLFSYRSRQGVDFEEFPVSSVIDPNQYDLNGVLTAVPAGKWTTQRVHWNPSLQKTVIVYGQKIYDNQQDAIFDINFTGVIDPELQYDSTPRCAIVVKQGASSLLDQSQAQFFDISSIGSGASGSGEVNSGQNVGGGAEVYQTKMAVFLVFRTLTSDTAAITITQNTDTINFDFIPSAVDHQTLSNIGTNTHNDIDNFIADINTYIDPRVILRETPNVLKVRPSPNPGEFSSIAAAVASITTNSSVNPWIVSVAPGIYVEPTIIMKPYVSVIGSGNLATIISAANPNNDLITASYASAIYNVTLTGSTGLGAALVRMDTASVNYRPFVLNTVSLGFADTYIDMNVSNSNNVSLILVNSTISGTVNAFRRAFSVKNSSTGSALLFINAVITTSGVSGSLPEDFLVVDGTGAHAIGGNNIFNTLTANTTNGCRIRNGGRIKMSSVSLTNLKTGVHIENIGDPSNIQANVFIFQDCVKDIDVEQDTATGYIDSPSDRSKLFLSPNTSVYVPGIDLQVIRVSKRGGDFTSIKDAVDSITDASASKIYTVSVGPGLFIEDTITMKPYVSIAGSGDVETVIQADGPNKHLIVGAINSSIRQCGLDGVSGAGYAAVYYAGGATFNPFIVVRCAFITNESQVIVEGLVNPLVIRLDSCRVIGNFTTGFSVTNNPGIFTQLLLVDMAFQFLTNPTPDVFYISGVGTNMIASNILITGSNTGNCVRISDGAAIRVISSNMSQFQKAIYVENIGAAPSIAFANTRISDGITDVEINHPGTTGFIGGVMSRSKIIDAPSQVVFTYSDLNSGSFTSTGELFLGPTHNDTTEVSDLFLASPMGLISGGVLSDGGGLNINVTSGFGYVDDAGLLRKIEWNAGSLVLSASSSLYIYYNSNGILSASAGFPDTKTNILLGRVITNASDIEAFDISPFIAEHSSNRFDSFARLGLGVVYDSGSIVSPTLARELNIANGEYFFSGNRYSPSGASPANLRTHYRNGLGGFIRSNTTIVDNANYDNNSGVLAPLTSSYYAKHSIYTVGQGIYEQYFLVYSQAEYANLTVAEQATLPSPPSYFNEGIVLIASIIVQEGISTIIQVRDERPVLGYKASGIAASSDHGNLLGLGDDDHPQYLRTDGSRIMSGSLDVGGNSIINVNLVDGVDVSAHASRHQPNGADPIPTAAAFQVRPDNVSSVGTSNSLSRSDHIHALPSAAPSTQTPDQVNAVGTANSVARSDHIHNIPAAVPVAQAPETGNIKGVAAAFALSDHQHDIPTDAPTTPLSATTVNAEGVGTSFARNDHTHSITTAAPVTQIPDQLNTVGTASELARADHVHNIPAAAPSTTLSPATTNAEGTGTSFARNDHTHAIATALSANISTILPDDTASAGTSDTFARGDHKHAIATDAPTTSLSATTANTEGVGTSFARNDHIHAIVTAAPSTQTPDQANAIGTAAALARADHIHNIPVDAPTTSLSATTANTEGVGTSFSRNDHTHAISTSAPSAQTPDQLNAVGTAATLARADHVHNIPTASAVGLNANTANGQGAASTFARADHTHAIATGTPSTQTPDQVNAVGSSTNLARADHVHNIPTAAPSVAIQTNTANGQGAAATFSRADHSHAIAMALIADISTVLPDDTAATGSSVRFAYADHRHAIATDAPTTPLSATTVNAEGTGTSFTRNDHTHSILTDTPSTQTPDQVNAVGVSANLARADHVHNIPTATPSSTGTANSQGSAAAFARADHVHSTVLTNYINSDTNSAQTNSSTDVLLTSMSRTPAAGTYLVTFSATTVNTNNGAEKNYFSVYVGGVQRANTLKRIGISGGAVSDVGITDIVTVNGSQAVEVRWRVGANTGTTYERTMTLVRLGP